MRKRSGLLGVLEWPEFPLDPFSEILPKRRSKSGLSGLLIDLFSEALSCELIGLGTSGSGGIDFPDENVGRCDTLVGKLLKSGRTPVLMLRIRCASAMRGLSCEEVLSSLLHRLSESKLDFWPIMMSSLDFEVLVFSSGESLDVGEETSAVLVRERPFDGFLCTCDV